MIDSLFSTAKNKFVMPFVIITALLLGVYMYAGVVGWKFFGKTTENWSPGGHTHTRTHK